MTEYLGQVLSFKCIQWNSFEVQILIDTKENFYKILDYYQHNNLDDYSTFTISIALSGEEEVLMTPDEHANECMVVYSDNLLEDVIGTESEALWQKGAIIDNLVYEIINSTILKPLNSKDIEINEED
ncbi:MAG: hypothetical protein IPL26_05745 [Leptospiraceae bacterium]|nr:hypothetical protein [Leptospiraceae bacterium]